MAKYDTDIDKDDVDELPSFDTIDVDDEPEQSGDNDGDAKPFLEIAPTPDMADNFKNIFDNIAKETNNMMNNLFGNMPGFFDPMGLLKNIDNNTNNIPNNVKYECSRNSSILECINNFNDDNREETLLNISKLVMQDLSLSDDIYIVLYKKLLQLKTVTVDKINIMVNSFINYWGANYVKYDAPELFIYDPFNNKLKIQLTNSNYAKSFYNIVNIKDVDLKADALLSFVYDVVDEIFDSKKVGFVFNTDDDSYDKTCEFLENKIQNVSYNQTNLEHLSELLSDYIETNLNLHKTNVNLTKDEPTNEDTEEQEDDYDDGIKPKLIELTKVKDMQKSIVYTSFTEDEFKELLDVDNVSNLMRVYQFDDFKLKDKLPSQWVEVFKGFRIVEKINYEDNAYVLCSVNTVASSKYMDPYFLIYKNQDDEWDVNMFKQGNFINNDNSLIKLSDLTTVKLDASSPNYKNDLNKLKVSILQFLENANPNFNILEHCRNLFIKYNKYTCSAINNLGELELTDVCKQKDGYIYIGKIRLNSSYDSENFIYINDLKYDENDKYIDFYVKFSSKNIPENQLREAKDLIDAKYDFKNNDAIKTYINLEGDPYYNIAYIDF